jgi:hypothetical protein
MKVSKVGQIKVLPRIWCGDREECRLRMWRVFKLAKANVTS